MTGGSSHTNYILFSWVIKQLKVIVCLSVLMFCFISQFFEIEEKLEDKANFPVFMPSRYVGTKKKMLIFRLVHKMVIVDIIFKWIFLSFISIFILFYLKKTTILGTTSNICSRWSFFIMWLSYNFAWLDCFLFLVPLVPWFTSFPRHSVFPFRSYIWSVLVGLM